MEKKAWTKTQYFRLALQIVLTLACVGVTVFIFSNSLKHAEQSTAQSAGVVKVVQEVATIIAPDSKIATATGADLDFLHSIIRNLAHFSEFALLGGLLCWCTFSYTFKKMFQILPPSILLLTACVDESLQLFSQGRAFQATDILIDCCGGIAGIAFAVLTVWFGIVVYKKRKVKKENAVA